MTRVCTPLLPLQNPILAFLVAERSNVLEQQTGLWYTEARV
jgi:hypothetical protein